MSVEKKEVGLQFLNNDAGEHEGLGDAGIETYRDSPYASSARECGQNSGDAGTAYPVILSFDLLEVPAADFPALEDYKAAVKICLEQASDKDDEKEFDFFVQAETALETEKIKILRISDENTTGLIGPAVDGTPYHALVKATGASQKGSKTSGGSFGIGKNAVYAISNFQTVFYSTVYLDEELGKERFLAQGKTKLTSHKGKDGIAKRATGYWGIKEGFQPVSDKNIVPDWLKRDKVGTSVFSIGFNEFPGWQYRMACSLIQNFFCAIHRGEMVFSVNDGEIQINQNSLQTLFKDEKVIQAAEDTNHLANFYFSRDLYECLISPESIETLKDVDGLGQVAIRVLIREDLPKRVCIIRNGMVITDSLENFGDKFSRFPMYRDFVALIESREDTGSTLIKKLENPRHDGLSAQRILDSKKQEAANATVKSLAVLIRETIKEQTILQHGDEVSIDEMSEFFADDDSSERRPDPDGEGDPETIIYEPPKKKRRKSPPVGKGKSGGAGGSGGEKGGKGGGKGPGAGGGKGGDGTMGESHLVELDSVRNTLIADGGSKKRVIYFTPLESGETSITVMASGLNDTEPLEIIKATGANVSFGKLVVDLIASDRTSVEVEFSEPYTGPLELLAISEAKTEEETKSENN